MVQVKERVSPGEVCRRAASRIHHKGWAQNAWENDEGGRCLVGAVNGVLGRELTTEMPPIMQQRIHDHLMASNNGYRGRFFSRKDDESLNTTIYRWNDLSATTASDVIGALLGIYHAEQQKLAPPAPAAEDAIDAELAQILANGKADTKQLVTA